MYNFVQKVKFNVLSALMDKCPDAVREVSSHLYKQDIHSLQRVNKEFYGFFSSYFEKARWFKRNYTAKPSFEYVAENTFIVLPKNRIAYTRSNHDICIKDLKTNKDLFKLTGHKTKIIALELQSEQIISGSEDNRVCVWDLNTGKLLHNFCGYVCNGDFFNSNPIGVFIGGKFVNFNSKMHFKNVLNKEHFLCQFKKDEINQVSALLPDGRIVTSLGKNLHVWDPQDLELNCQHELVGHDLRIKKLVVLSKDRLISVSYDNTMRIWNINTGECLWLLEGHTGWIENLVILSDKRLLTSSWDKTLRLWDTSSGKCQFVFKGHTSFIGNIVSLADSRIISYSFDGILKIWDIKQGICLSTINTEICSNNLALLSDTLVILSSNKVLHIWNIITQQRFLEYRFANPESIDKFDVLADGNILCHSNDGICKLEFLSVNPHQEQISAILDRDDRMRCTIS